MQKTHKTLFVRLLLLLFFLSISRMLLLFLNSSLFGEIKTTESLAIWFYGLHFDLSALFMINGLFILLYTLPLGISYKAKYIKAIDFSVILVNSFAFLVNAADAIYFRFTLRRTTSSILDFTKANDGFLELIPQFIIDFWYILVIWAIFTWLLVRIYTLSRKNMELPILNWKFYTKQSTLFILSAGIIVLGIRGGLQLKPIKPMNAAHYVSAEKMPLVLNTPFTFFKSIGKKTLERKNYFSDKKLASIYTPEHFRDSSNSFPAKKLNVVLIILESFSVEHFRYFNRNLKNGKYPGFTPFLDSLFEKSLVFKGISNGKRSMDAIPAIISSLPSLTNQSFISSSYSSNKINSLAELLAQNGYYSAFFHGGKNGTMSFDSFAKIAGFDDYFGKNEYNNDKDFDGKWGIWDEKYFQYFAKKMGTMKSPFFTTIFSLSSHHPYSIPAEHKGKFRKGKLEIQQAVQYSDYALKRFFETAKQMPWFENTLFVITADHTSEGDLSFYKNSVGQYQVPIAFYAPSDSSLQNRKARKMAQQADIMPSIIDYLSIQKDYIAFGNSVFDTILSNFAVNFANNHIQLFKDDYLMLFAEDKVKSFFNLKKDSLLSTNLVNSNNKEQLEMEEFIKAYIQQYNNRLIDNKLKAEEYKTKIK